MRVQWVHPTWRELVIAQLAGDEAARRRFLLRSGVYGIELALSTANDDPDARRLPLIGCDGDRDAVADRLFELVTELEPTELLALLACLGQAIEELEGCGEALEAHAMAKTTAIARGHPVGRRRITDPPAPAGRVVRGGRPHRWTAQAPTPIPDLGRAPPRLQPEPDDRAAVERFADWLSLCELLWDYDPELKTRLGHNDEHVELMASFVGRVELHKSLARPEADQVRRALELIAGLEPGLEPLARFVGRDLPATAAVRTSGQARDYPEPPAPELFEVRRVLADL